MSYNLPCVLMRGGTSRGPFFLADWLGKPAWMWLAFMGVVVALLVLDLGVLHKDQHEIGVRESLLLSGMYIAIALMFGGDGGAVYRSSGFE